MKLEKLGDHCIVKNGFAFKSKEFVESGTPVVRIADIRNDKVILENSAKIKPSNAYESYSIQEGAILIAMSGATTGKIGRFKESVKAYQNQRVGCFVTNEKTLSNEYLYVLLRSYQTIIQAKAFGGGQPNISAKELESLMIPFPPLGDQIRIATLLSRVQVLIARRKDNLRLLDEFLKSTFLEMFGDPVRNEKGWKRQKLGDLLSAIEGGWSPKCESRQANIGEWGVLKLGAVTHCKFVDSENKALPKNVKPKRDKEVKKGDLLFTRKNTYDLVAACAYVYETKPQIMISDLIFRLVIKDESILSPIYLWKLLINQSQRKNIQALAGGAAGSMPNISKQNLRKVLLPLPPINLQNQFASIVQRVESLRILYQQNLKELENLYGALSQKAFKGDLDLSRIPLPTITANVHITAPLPSIRGEAVTGKAMSHPEGREKTAATNL